jgi:hypothetical protein
MRFFIFVHTSTLKIALGRKDSAPMLHDGKAGEPGQAFEIRWAQAQRGSPSG